MAPAVSNNGGEGNSRLCARCFIEIKLNMTKIKAKIPSSHSQNPVAGDGSLLLGSRKRKRVAELNEEPSNEVAEPTSEDLALNISPKYSGMDEDYSDSDDDEATGDYLPAGTDFSGLSFAQVIVILQEKIKDLGLPEEGRLGTAAILAAISFLQTKHSRRREVKSNRPHPHPGDEIKGLLRGLENDSTDTAKKQNMGKVLEEDRHPWYTLREHENSPAAPKIYLRIWDDKSVARIREGKEGFLSGSNFMPLHTKQQRKRAIEDHANWGNRRMTPFISTTTDIRDITTSLLNTFERRQSERGLLSITKITLINGNANGMPILSMRRELDHYQCETPKSVRHSIFDNEHLFLFRIPSDQIVKTWLWKDVEQWLASESTEDIQRWYQQVLIPAYNRHEHNRKYGPVAGAHEPNCTCCGH